MSGIDTLSMALKNLYKRKLRTFLTVLGVVVGACAIIIMISLGVAINQSFDERMMSTRNATVVQIWNYQVASGNERGVILDDAMFQRIKSIPNVEAATPLVNIYNIRSAIGRYSTYLDIYGVYPEALPYIYGYEVKEGRMLTSDDEWGILFGSNVPYNYKTAREQMDWRSWQTDTTKTLKINVLKDRIKMSFDSSFGLESYYSNDESYYEEAPVDDESTVKVMKPYNIYGVGILEAGEDWMSMSACFMNLSTVQKLQEDMAKYYKSMGWGNYWGSNYEGYTEGYIKVKDVKSIEGVMDEIIALGFNKDYVYSSTSYINELKETMSSLQVLLGAMGVISLFIATIGISNTMIMSTVERTKEIGVMKVIGASLRDIRKLFLLESAIIGFLGGALGVGVSYLASYILNKNGLSFFKFVDYYSYGSEASASKVSVIPLWLSLASLGVAALVGLVAGFFPAQRATRLSALAAIKSE